MRKNERGITLIALVITVIVLLILAGVSIAMLTGNNGILTQAQRAKNETEQAQANEENLLGNYEDTIYKATGDVKQVDDSNPGVLEGSGTQQEPFVINSIEDLVVFADNVTKGTNTYQNQYVELGLSLDFNSDKSYVNPDSEDYAQYGYNGKLKEVLNTSGFIPIGLEEGTIAEIEEKSFYGEFNGKGFSVNNMKIHQEKTIEKDDYFLSGMFSNNMGSIENLYIRNGIIYEDIKGGNSYSASALLVGRNKGTIQNSYVSGKINTLKLDWACNIGGLVGANSGGKIKECCNEADVYAKYSIKENRVGGISGVNEESGIIENVYNTGSISSEIFDKQSEDDDVCYVGGILGRNNVGSVKNAYSIGKVSNINNEEARTEIGGVVGYNYNASSEKCDLNNCYYLENLISSSNINTKISEDGEVKESSQMKSQEFLDLLNQDNSGMWKFSSGKNNGYPVLYWE